MKPTNVLRLLGGSIAVYLIMAACSGVGSSGFGVGDGGTTHDGSHGDDGAVSIDGNGVADAVLDSIMNPVGDAKADVNVSGSRLKARNYVGADGSKQWMGWHDIMRNEDCSFGIAADGLMRCLPGGAGASALYADAGCTQALGLVTKGCTAPGYVLAASGTCGNAGSHVYTAGAAFTGSTAYYLNTGSCTTYPAGALASYQMAFDLYTTGTEVPPSAFVSATIQIDP